MENNQLNQPKKTNNTGLNPLLTILLLLIISVLTYIFILGDDSNFVRLNKSDIINDLSANEGTPSNVLGIIYKGGFIVPILMTFALMVIVFSIERFFILSKAAGTKSISQFMTEIKTALEKNEINYAIELCDQQKGSVGNVVKESLLSYKNLGVDQTLSQEQKLNALNQTIEEAVTLEMPSLEKNMNILSTIASVATLVALMGTVMGMIKSFFALGNSGGAPDAAQLSNGIAEALINTALGIGASALAIIAYNYFTSKIDNLIFKIEEIGFIIQKSFKSKH
ncbi:MotA/TolQ/ExbB proton channel family protein [Apibacter muscae]|uniref:MotA/TolQ/ExbB proton channel family protein n=1 Tax=Apibacter muscae TaxID=2509004 RepID=A0A563D7I1_9FLAO|nr:MotA/TolQ/ExbB proton channel family protein [Apibacter muscae]TWP26047.1 MotA/TolQ/ExbB proton channel family protein [Apibacter muscae]